MIILMEVLFVRQRGKCYVFPTHLNQPEIRHFLSFVVKLCFPEAICIAFARKYERGCRRKGKIGFSNSFIPLWNQQEEIVVFHNSEKTFRFLMHLIRDADQNLGKNVRHQRETYVAQI